MENYDDRRTRIVKSYKPGTREYKVRLGKMLGKTFPPFKILEFNDVYASNYRFKAECLNCGYLGVYLGSKIKHGDVACQSCGADAKNYTDRRQLSSADTSSASVTISQQLPSEAYIAEFKKMNEHLSDIVKELREISFRL